jgi:hypothetical protein
MSLLLALLLCVPADTFTVDDDGAHADFPSLVAAVAAVSPGDILKVEAGEYEPFILTKNVVIMGPADGPRPRVHGLSVVHDVAGAMIGGLDFGSFAAESVSGSLLLDDCTFGFAPQSVSPSTLELVSCDAVEVQRCVVHGLDDSGGTALHVVDSGVRGGVPDRRRYGRARRRAGLRGNDGEKGRPRGSMRRTPSSPWPTASSAAGQGGAGCRSWRRALAGAAGDGLVAVDSKTTVRGAPTDSVSAGP